MVFSHIHNICYFLITTVVRVFFSFLKVLHLCLVTIIFFTEMIKLIVKREHLLKYVIVMFFLSFFFENLFPFRMQHFHEERLGRRATSTVFHVKMLLTSRCHYMNFWYNTEQFTKFILNFLF